MCWMPLVGAKKGEPHRPFQVTTQIVSHKEPPSIWVRAQSGNSYHTSACGLPQHPCAKPSKINTQFFHHRLRFTMQSIMAIVVLGAPPPSITRHVPPRYGGSKLALIKWKPWSRCKWPIVEKVAGVTGILSARSLGAWFSPGGCRRFVRPQSRSD